MEMFSSFLSTVVLHSAQSGPRYRTHTSSPIRFWTSAQHFCSNCGRFFTAGVRLELILSLYLSIEENHHMFEMLKVSACVSACSAFCVYSILSAAQTAEYSHSKVTALIPGECMN